MEWMLIIWLLQTYQQAIEVFGVSLLVAASAIGGVLGTVRGIKKYRENQVRVKAAEEAVIQGRITKEINEVKEQHGVSVTMATRLADGERRLFEQSTREKEALERRIKDLETMILVRDGRLKELTEKLEDIVDYNLNLQGQVTELRARVLHNTGMIESLRKDGGEANAEK